MTIDKTEALFEVTEYDTQFYKERLEEFLPPKIIDIHTHSWLEDFRIDPGDGPRRAVTWPSLVARDNPVEALAETFRLLLPGKECGALIFGFPDRTYDVDASNDYVASAGPTEGFDGLMLTQPGWDADEYAKRLDAGRFLGAKVYLNFAPEHLQGDDLRIFDFAPHHQLEVLNSRGAILMLHIPRSGRLKDPVNIADMVEIERKYPNMQTIIAHVGRAYCDSDLGDSFERLADSPGLLFDISANTNAHVFAEALRAVGPERLLFGSDLPITRMRMRRFCDQGLYVNVVPPGLYGDISGDPNMLETSLEEAQRLTFFFYEEIDAFRRAAEECSLSKEGVNQVFYANAVRVLDRAKEHYFSSEIKEEK